MSKFAMQFLCRFAVSFVSLLFGCERTKVMWFFINLDSGPPRISTTAGNPFESREISAAHFTVANVLGLSGYAQITSSVVQGVASFDVVALDRIIGFKPENKTVHVNSRPLTISVGLVSDSIKRLGVGSPSCIPLPLVEPFEVGGIDNRKLSLGEWNKAVRFFWASSLFTQVHVMASPKAVATRL